MTEPANAAQLEYWNAARNWVDDQAGHDEMLEPLGRLAHNALAPATGERILDIGCGTGATTLALAADVGPSGEVIGADLSTLLVTAARERAEGLDNVSFIEADAQVHELGSLFDGAFSRFGVMFFEDPVAAFTNVAGALRPGGRLAFVCWGDPPSNEWWSVPARAVAEQGVVIPAIEDPTAPGPFSLADPLRVQRILNAAGLTDIELTDARKTILLGGKGSLDTALGHLRRSRMGKAIVERASEAGSRRVFDAVAEALSPYLTARGIEMTAAVWVATARCP